MRLVTYTVRSGDNLTQIGRRFGMSWRELYEHPENSALRARRPDPNEIFPGDAIIIPGTRDAARRLGAFPQD